MRKLVGAIPLIGVIVAWYFASEAHLFSEALLPSPGAVIDVYINEWSLMATAIGTSVLRVFVGLVLAAATAIPLGLLLGRYQPLYWLLDWTIQIFRCFPGIALIPLAILFFGIGNKPAIILIWLAATWPLLINTIFGVTNVEKTLLRVARSAHASEFMTLREILLPGALPAILTGLRLAVGAGWLTVVTAEMIAVRSGLGYLIMYAQAVFRADQVVAGIIAIGFVGLLFDVLIRYVRRRVCAWQEGLVLSS
jgi:ABC-type nitrate/sulfonate/bicarbonate transport system permease component